MDISKYNFYVWLNQPFTEHTYIISFDIPSDIIDKFLHGTTLITTSNSSTTDKIKALLDIIVLAFFPDNYFTFPWLKDLNIEWFDGLTIGDKIFIKELNQCYIYTSEGWDLIKSVDSKK